MAVMSPQLSASNHSHDQKPEAVAPALAEADNAASQGTMAMDLDVHGTIKQDESTSAPLPDFAPSSPKDELNSNGVRASFVNGNASAQKINAPPSPPIPTPPLHQADSTQELSDLHITSPAAGAPTASFHGNGQTAVGSGEKVEGENGDERKNGALHRKLKSTSAATDVSMTSDHSMIDAPSVKTSREREEDDNEGPPLKRAKTEEMDTSSSFGAPLYNSTDPITSAQLKWILGVVRSLRRTKDARPFSMPVDAEKLNVPTYYEIVKNPMDLQTMEKKLHNTEYKSPKSVLDDFSLILSNCILFNGVEHPVTEMSKSMQGAWERQMKGFPPSNAPEAEKPRPSKKKGGSQRPSSAANSAAKAPKSTQTKKEPKTVAQSPIAASPTFGLQPSGIPQIRRDSTAGDGRPKREIHPPAPKDLPYSDVKPRRKKNASELKFCDMVCKELSKKIHEAYAFPFYTPVDPVALNIPDYFKIIKKPMDLSTIQSKLKTNQYETGHDFEQDIRLMFRNCYKFNPPNQAVHQMGKRLEGIFDQKWAEKGKYTRENPGSHSPVSASPPPEEQEDEMSEEEGNQPDIAALEQQLEMMKDQISSLKKGQKKKTPPVSSNSKSKNKSGSSRKNSTVVPLPPPSKGKKKGGKNQKDVPYISLEQKTELSERINFLPHGKMAYALNMIKQNMPDLDNGAGDEIELDIDELDSQTLQRLYTYVSKHAPPLETKYVPPPPPPRPVPEQKTKTKTTSKPKKNKPMSAVEQEAMIKDLQARLQNFDNPTPQPSAPAALDNADSDSSDDDESSGSESEEE